MNCSSAVGIRSSYKLAPLEALKQMLSKILLRTEIDLAKIVPQQRILGTLDGEPTALLALRPELQIFHGAIPEGSGDCLHHRDFCGA